MQLLAQQLPPGFEKKIFNGLPVLELKHSELCCVCKLPRHIFRLDGSVTARGHKGLICVICGTGESPARRSV